ncbi:MAG: leucine-rich repeat protein [Ruminococcus sp.]|uniref:leucine-rich repeat protein n=1 Tax=Ruminococcus sp. TaxID=41978 RepID=UPI0025D2CD07|nr:leucine-rich repeat protein [Ruminococcus sp.]MBR5684408.1 leucine-rich repeat protein [Ruminococcus sp.]
MKKSKIMAAVTAALLVGGAFPTAALPAYAVNHVSCITVETDEFTKIESFTQFGIIYDVYQDHAAVRSLTAEYREKTEKFDITIPDTIKNVPVTEINGTAIYGTKVENVTFGRNIKTIGSYAFEGCTELRSIELPEELLFIGSGAFYRCENMEKIMFNRKLTTIGRNAFALCSGLTSVQFPDSLVKIDESAFEGCTSISEISFGRGLEFIGENAFHKCEALRNIKLGDRLKTVGCNAFYDKNISSLEIPASVGTLNGCPISAYKSDDEPKEEDTAIIIKNPNCSLRENLSDWTSFIIVCSEGSAAQSFAEENGIRYCTPEQYESGDYEKKLDPTKQKSREIFRNDNMYWCKADDGYEVFDVRMGDGEELVIPDDIDGVPVVAVSNYVGSNKNNPNVKKVQIGKNVRTVWDGSFYSFPALEEAVIGEKLEKINMYTFYGCQYLKKITFKEECSLKTISSYAIFSDELKRMVLPESVEYVERMAINSTYRDEVDGLRVAVLNPDCYLEPSSIRGNNKTIIFGYKDSTAEKYASDYGLKFMRLDPDKEFDESMLEIDVDDIPVSYDERTPGDANCNGKVEMGDAVRIMQALANPDKYGIGGTDENHITKQGVINGDVYQPGTGITSLDARWIQGYLVGDYNTL